MVGAGSVSDIIKTKEGYNICMFFYFQIISLNFVASFVVWYSCIFLLWCIVSVLQYEGSQ